MDYAHIVAISLHALSGVFWAGTSFALARLGANGARLFGPQIVAALIAVASGVYLWTTTQAGDGAPGERVLGIGSGLALLALLIQLLLGGLAARNLQSSSAQQEAARARFSLAQRAGAALLAVTIVCMVSARYVW